MARPASVTLARPPRDVRMDILRGWMQVSIFISHTYGSIFFWGIHAAWGVSDSSEQFVLLSGLALGSVFTLKRARDGFQAATSDLAGRVGRLYVTHLVVFALFAAMMIFAERAVPVPGLVEEAGWKWLVTQPWQAVPGALALLYQPTFMDILPIFVFCMIGLAPFLWLLERVGDRALLVPLGLYAVTQIFGLRPMGLGGTEITFDPFAWQVLFMIGAWVGRRTLLGEPPLPRHPLLFVAAGLVLAAGLWIKLGHHGVVPLSSDFVEALAEKGPLAPLRLAHALALAWLVSVLVPRDVGWMHGAVPRLMAVIGRHSLQVFCLGLFLSWWIATAFRELPVQAWWIDLLAVPAGVVVLGAFAMWRESQRPAARRVPARSPG
ncbi:OpgC family protein [Roseomonas sp. AR75]|uniref:OpgC family protein n=1 Tax=Roseomonas sp. AR75 TaxID=2562311 RepID=UPI0010C0D5CE|nr:OpgC domain-containing protein [Roseomonas sp. AR75]